MKLDLVAEYKEIWKPIPRYEGLYEVSDQGRVRTLERTYLSGRNMITRRKIPSKLKSQTRDKDNYPRVTLCKDGKKKRVRVHNLVLLAFVGECPPGQEVRHLDHSKDNNRLKNLVYGTPKENAADRSVNPTYKHPMIGRKHSTKAKMRMSESHKRLGIRYTPEARKKMSERMLGPKNHFYGKTHTLEARRKISEARKRKTRK